MKFSRATLAMLFGLAGFIVGVIAAINGEVLGAAAGGCALIAGTLGFLTGKERAAADEQLAAEKEQSSELEATVASQVQARITAEDAVRSLSEELAETQRNESERASRIEQQLREQAAEGDSSTTRGSLTDRQTGLFAENYYRAALESRIAAARRHLRPVATVLIDVVEGAPENPRPCDPTFVSEQLEATLRESDTACRTNKGLFALVLEDTPENGAVWTVERIRRRLTEERPDLTVWAGVACYPAHAFDARDLVGKASEALVVAAEWHQDRIEVAVSDS